MRILALPLLLALASGPAWAQADPAADLLNQARDAAAKGDPKTAAQRYQDFLQKFATHAQAPAVRVPLAIALLQAPDRDFAKIAPLLDQAADDAALADRSAARYWGGVVHREISRRQPAKDAGPETEKAAKRFAEAVESYDALAKDWVDDGKAPLTPAVEGAIQARAGRVEALLALGKTAEATDAARGLEKAKGLSRSASGPAAIYLCGCAFYSADEAIPAGRALVRLAPFDQVLFGAHARFLLARIHHAARETTEALDHYDAVAPLFTLQVMAARKLIQSNSPGIKDQPLERARLEALANGPAPEFVGDALLDAGSLLYETKRFVEAQDRLVKFLQQNPKHSRLDEGRYLAGIAAVQAGKPAEAVGALQPLLAHPRLGPQARAWFGRAVVRAADPAKPDDVKAALGKAAEQFRLAAEEMAKQPEGAAAAAGLYFEQADALHRSGKLAEAIAAYRKAAGGPREEEAAVRLVGCLQLSGDLRGAEEAFRRFEKEHPRSPFLPEALFHYAECGYAAAQGAAESAASGPIYDEALKRYELLLARYPDSPAAPLSRFRVAMAHHARGQYAESAAALAAIPEADRGGPLIGASYILADALLRSGPPVRETVDALSASARLQQLTLAIGALRAFVASQPPPVEAPEATIKLGFALQQVAWLQADPQERVKAAGAAREVYEGFRTAFPTHPLRATAEYERANCYALAGDAASALTKLPRFHAEPFVKSPIAPIAMLREAQILRSLNRFPEAAAVMAQARQLHEETLKKDDARAAWVPLLRYHHGVCLREAKQNAEAIKIFQSVVAEYPSSEWAKSSKEMLEETK